VNKEPFEDGELQKLVDMYQEDIGGMGEAPDLDAIEDPEEQEKAEEEYLERWALWAQAKIKFRPRKGSVPALTLLEQKEQELKERDPLFAHIAEHLGSTPASAPSSLVRNDWIPTPREAAKEVARRDAALHRYPHGYRHYENYHNYRTVYPDRTLQDYANDINSQITFEEFFVMAQKDYLHDAEHDPSFRFRMGFDRQPEDSSYEEEKTAEAIVRRPAFRAEVHGMFKELCEEALTRKSWFSKVEALEAFTDFWGTHPRVMMAHYPMANTYVPATGIVPIPMFRDYKKEDPKGLAFAYRTKDRHTVGELTPPNTLRPHHMSPDAPSQVEGKALREYD